MTPMPKLTDDQTVPSKVSILARLVPSFSYVIAMLGAALTAILLMRVMEAIRNAESAGISAVAAGMAGADFATIVALCLAIFQLRIHMLESGFKLRAITRIPRQFQTAEDL